MFSTSPCSGTSRLWLALLHTLIIAAVALPAELILGMLMALLFLERLPGRQIFVALLVLPIMIAPVVAGATWRLLFDNRYGPINQILGWFAGEPVTILWTINPHFVYPAILIAEIWQWTPFMFLLQLAAFMNIDQSLTESAQIDGASYWMIFRRIMLPAIWPVVAIAVLIRGLDLFRLFDVVWALTEGGPGTMTETISIYTYDRGFRQFDTSYTGAIAFLVIVLLSLVDRGGAATHGDRSMKAYPVKWRGPRRRTWLLIARYAAAVARDDFVPVPGLLAVHDRLQDAGRDLPFAAGLVSGADPVREFCGAVQGSATR